MDRYNELKLQLKSWEQEFLKQHQRKPTKEDIDRAPEETRRLYKEYRSLKQVKGISSNDASSDQRQAAATAETNPTNKELDCWGAHLNRKAMPVSAPRLSSRERDDLMTSSQYYGLKLKNNLAALSKEKPVSLKKPHRTGRVPLNSLKDDQESQNKNLSTVSASAEEQEEELLMPRGMKPFLGSATPKSLHAAEPEEHFKPFKPESEQGDAVNGCSDSSSVSSHHCTSNSSQLQGVKTSLPARSSPLLSSLSPQCLIESTGKENKGTVDKVEDPNSGSPTKKVDPEVPGGLKRSPPLLAQGGLVKRPSLANRLSFLDRNWLERCQVFGEMEAEEIPGGGNREMREKEIQEKEVREEKAKRDLEGNRRQSVDLGEEEKSANALRDNPNPATDCALRGAGEKKGTGNIERGQASPLPRDHNDKDGLKSEGAKKRGRKRQREGDDTVGSVTVDGAKKKRRNNKKSEESSAVSPDPADGGEGKKKKTKRKDIAEREKKEATQEAKKAPQENLLGELQEEFRTKTFKTQPVKARGTKGAEGNFVKINLKTKSHVKGYALRGVALRKQLYMQKFQLKGERFGGGAGYFGRGRRGGFRGSLSRQGDTCYKCGGTGHWALDCKGRVPPPPVSEDPPAEEEPFELPTLEEVARATGTLKPQPLATPCVKAEQHQEESGVDSGQTDEMLLNVIRPDYERPAPPPPMEPLYPLTEDGTVQETPAEVYAALRELGYQSFRPGQEKAIMRILTGLSTLVVLSTGMGKSLCYQLPAYLYAQRSKCITLVISPLVSLMDDQLSGLPTKLKAACIHSNMTMKQREAAVEKVKSGQVCLLLLSPEALVGGGGSGSGCLPSAQELPPVAFACIDEAHCVSEWSHNFRPCYLRLCKVLRERLGVKCLLGLTATATLSTALDIAQHLDISDKDGIAVRSAAVPPNLNLSVSMDREKDQALVCLLKGDRFGCLDSIIVYCTRREETVRVAALLRTCLQGVALKENTQISSNQIQNNPVGQKKKELARKKIRKPLKWQAEAYHAGLSGSERRRVQNNFMCGELRIVVATVAFGMGLDKSDVRGIIHYNMPKSFESYVQEIGRAGRDGEPAHCHLFLDPEGGDLQELRRHIYADTVDYYIIKKLVQRVFPACKCKKIQQKQQELWKEVEDTDLLEMMDVCDPDAQEKPTEEKQESIHLEVSDLDSAAQIPVHSGEGNGRQEQGESEEGKDKEADGHSEQKEDSWDWPEERVCHTHERAIPIQETVEALDITEEGIETLLCYLELHPQRFVELLHPTLSACKVRCYDGPRQLQKITKICPPVAVVLARQRMRGERVESLDQVEFDVVEVADTMGWQLPMVKRGLRQLQWSTERGGGRSGIHVEFSSPSFYFRSFGDLSDEEMDRVCQFLYNRVQDQERTQLYQLTACFKAFKSVAFQSAMSCVNDLDESRSLQLKNLLSEYFDRRRDREHALQPVDLEEPDKYRLLDWENQIRADIRSFLGNRSDERFSGRAVARILHGIGSPCYPAQIYGKDRRYWRKYIQFDFNQLIRLATQEILHFK
ncbi:PREDICTED: ATP-dependent DNA helicase Q4 isoform X2 [Cyprinodon variegatus]|uniref:ATP-dependent DNA helicase Q4 isoform X2 n=1 Tax=Cyprinodon variegatus TaxID=28743 RepID=UPI0007426DE6|nr:PREDICTED: ATP-dependent DNA helicase Q4 isoform X2 [Cyprinodon variegatus]